MRKAVAGWWSLIGGLVLALFVGSAPAAPAHCSYGYQDSSCLGPQYRAAQTAPICPTDAGWTTLTPAKWIGSRFAQPQCNYEAPPTCPNGDNEIGAPVWNGSSWVGLSCELPQLPRPTPQDELAACIARAKAVAIYPVANNPVSTGGPYASVGWSAYLQPMVWSNGNTVSADSPALFAGIGSFDPPQVSNDMFFIQGGPDLFRQSLNFCFVQPGTTNIIGFYNFASLGVTNNSVTPNPPTNTGFTLMPRDRWYNPSGSYQGLYYQGPSGTLMQ